MGDKGKGIRGNYNHTIYASYLGSNSGNCQQFFLLFLTFQNMFQISLEKISTGNN